MESLPSKYVGASQLHKLAHEMDQMFDQFLYAGDSLDTIRIPRSDLEDRSDSYVVSSEIPGVKKEDIKVTLNNNILTISAASNQDYIVDRGSFVQSERSYSSFKRSFELPQAVEKENVDAEYCDGILKIVLPKVKKAIDDKEIKVR